MIGIKYDLLHQKLLSVGALRYVCKRTVKNIKMAINVNTDLLPPFDVFSLFACLDDKYSLFALLLIRRLVELLEIAFHNYIYYLLYNVNIYIFNRNIVNAVVVLFIFFYVYHVLNVDTYFTKRY